MANKPKVVILGGLGFIGRNLVEYLADNGLVSKIRVADKALPDLAFLNKKQAELFKSDLVEFKQANLARQAMVDKVIDDSGWDFVFNLAGETKLSQTPEVYKENIVDVSFTCANTAAKKGVKRFIEVSTGQVYEAGKKPSDEHSKIKPWTSLAEAKFEAENKLRNEVKGLPIVFVRPAIVYGPGDITGITPRIICAAVYKQLGEKMEYLWDKDLILNTVHVRDVCAALWHLTAHGDAGAVYNLVDQNETDQGAIAGHLEKIFGIKSSFMGSIASKLATAVAMKTVAETANEKHLKPWSDLCKAAGITNTPLTPYLDEELLYNNSLSMNGTLITKTGFNYKFPKMSEELLREVITYFVELGIFPRSVLG